MDDVLEIRYEQNPEESAWGIIGRGISQYNKKQAGDNKFQHLCFVLEAPDETIVGGLVGETYWEWFFVDLLWVEEELRGRGYGYQLLMKAEEEARRRGAKSAYLDTFSFQAPDFYQRQGYRVFGDLKDFPPGYERYFMMKEL